MPTSIPRLVPSRLSRAGGVGGSERTGPFCRLVLWLASRSPGLAGTGRHRKVAPSAAGWHESVALLWEHGRPVLYLAALCLLAALALARVSPELGLVFCAAAAGALALFFWIAQNAAATVKSSPAHWVAESRG